MLVCQHVLMIFCRYQKRKKLQKKLYSGRGGGGFWGKLTVHKKSQQKKQCFLAQPLISRRKWTLEFLAIIVGEKRCFSSKKTKNEHNRNVKPCGKKV